MSSACSLFHHSLPSLLRCQQSHATLLKSGHLPFNIRLATKLLSLYSRHLRFSDATDLLLSLPEPDPFSFSTLITASSSSSPSLSLSLFRRSLSLSLPPDAFALPSAIKSAALLSCLSSGRQLHALSAVSGLSLDPFVQSSLVHMYLKCEAISDAHQLFERMPHPNIIGWSAMISSYASRGCVDEALRMFEEMRRSHRVEPNLVTWNGLVAGFNRSGHPREAVLIMRRMHSEGFSLDGTSASSALSAVGDTEDVSVGRQVHGYAVKAGLGLGGCMASALIDMYGKYGQTEEMIRAFDDFGGLMDVGSCNALLTGLSRNGRAEEALDSFRRFQEQGVQLNVVSWTSVIACCAQNGKDLEGLNLFRDMQVAGVKPNAVTIPCMLPACANIAALMHGKSAHCFALRSSISDDVYVGSALVDMYAKCGRIKEARALFELMPSRNAVSWNAMMGGYAMHGKANDAIELFELMQKRSQRPDFITFTCILSACSQAGLTEEGRYYFNAMNKGFSITARSEHYACMVSLLGRSGKLEEAYGLIQDMPFDADACIWGAFLSSCRVHGNVRLGEIAAEKLFELEPENPGNYVLLSNIYASKGMWSGVDRMRDKMKSMGMKKDPGCSWIEVKNKVHMLMSGDKAHPQMGQIIERLERLSTEMKRLGYSPGTDFVLQDVEEQEKEHILCGHSEKLAVAFGLINTSTGTALRVIKNLRICGDCHTFMKFVSGFERRELLVRDTNRFHHFKDGCCSCGDYW